MRGVVIRFAVAVAIAGVVGCGNKDKADKDKDKNKTGANDPKGKTDPTPSPSGGSGSEKALCGKAAEGIASAQNSFATEMNQRGLPEYFANGIDRVVAKAMGKEPGATGTADPSRAYAYLIERGYMPAENLVCPADPFVVALDPKVTAPKLYIRSDNDGPDSKGRPAEPDKPLPAAAPEVLKFNPDLHGPGMVEGEPVANTTGWASAGSTATTAKGRTFFSYSLQTSSLNVFAHTTPKMNAKIPVVADRNPFCDTLVQLSGEAPTAKSDAGNSWNHGRKGQTLAFADGHTYFVEDASSYQVPLNPGIPNRTMGFDYIYGSGGLTEAAAKPPADGKCLKAGEATPEPYKLFGVWMID